MQLARAATVLTAVACASVRPRVAVRQCATQARVEVSGKGKQEWLLKFRLDPSMSWCEAYNETTVGSLDYCTSSPFKNCIVAPSRQKLAAILRYRWPSNGCVLLVSLGIVHINPHHGVCNGALELLTQSCDLAATCTF